MPAFPRVAPVNIGVGRPVKLWPVSALICAALAVASVDRAFAEPGRAGLNAASASGATTLEQPSSYCVGDCDESGDVRINELVTLVDIALGSTLPVACPNGVPSGGAVDIASIILAVKNGLEGCDVSTPPPTGTATEIPSPADTATALPTPTSTAEASPTPTATESRGAAVAIPTIEGPVSGGRDIPFLVTTTFDLAQVGYMQEEYFMSGTATAYASADPLALDGRWTTIAPAETAAYKTRLLVYRPIDPQRFNGTVVVEWLDVTNGVDSAFDWCFAHTELIRSGYAWVGVSAQALGVEGGAPPYPGALVLALKIIDPRRYGSLAHPGDSFSYDIFSQAAQAIRRPAGVRPLGDLPVAAVIATGDAEGGARLTTYTDAVHPFADIYDGFLIHSRSGSDAVAAPLAEPPQTLQTVPGAVHIRDDLDVPVLTFETETDVSASYFDYQAARQEDSERFRLWEVAGSARSDTYFVPQRGDSDLGDSPDIANLLLTMVLGLANCPATINSGPHHFVFKAAVAALNRWVRYGTPPPSAPRLTVDGSVIQRDDEGNALGGVRTPQLEVPIATLSGEGQTGDAPLCRSAGTTFVFDSAKLAALYPDHDTYVAQFDTATERAVEAGIILAPDATLMKAAAEASDIGK